MAENTSAKASQDGLRVLTIHGGGLQGLAIISVIDELCSRISQGSMSNKSQVPSELFDIICGTGIGALIATLFGRYQLDVSRCKQVYMDLSDYLEERNASRRSSGKIIRQEDVHNFLQTLVRDEGWSDSMDYMLDGNPLGQQHFVLASRLTHRGKSTVDVFRGSKLPVNTRKPLPGAQIKGAKVSLRTAQAVAHPIPSFKQESSPDEFTVTQHGQQLHEIVGVALHHAKTFCSPCEVTFMANIGPSMASNETMCTSSKLPDSPREWVAQKVLPITSPIKSIVKATMKTLSGNESTHPVQEPQRTKSLSMMQWPIQGLGFSLDHPKTPIAEANQDTVPAEALAPAMDLGERLFNFDTTIQGLAGGENDMTDLRETRASIRHMVAFMHASGLFEEAVMQHRIRRELIS